jgi:hypothetical protein
VKERKYAHETAAEDDVIVEEQLETAEESPAAPPIADAVAAQPPAHENGGNGPAEPQAAPEDAGLGAAKHAIIHEWENWSALHSDELDDPNVAEYFCRHLHVKKPDLLHIGIDKVQAMLGLVAAKRL